MRKEQIVKRLSKIRSQIGVLQAQEGELERELQQIEDAEKMKFIDKNKISMDRLILLNQVSEDEIRRLLEEKQIEELKSKEIVGGGVCSNSTIFNETEERRNEQD